MILNPEDRKECQDLNKIRKQNLRGKKAGLSAIDMCMIRECAKKQAEKMENRAIDNAFLYMLAIPLNVLVNDYWSKSAKKRAPKFINDVMSLYEAVQDGTVSKEELSDLLKDMAGIDVNEELKKRGVKDETTSTM